MFQPGRSRVGVFVCLSVLAIVASGCSRGTPSPQPSPPPQAAVVPSPVPVHVAAAPLPVWQPDPALLDELEPYRDVDGYQIRLPKGCEAVPTPPVPYTKATGWKGPSRADGSKLAVFLLATTVPPTAPDYAFTAQQELNAQVQGFKKTCGLSDWHETMAESGQVGGALFVRLNFQGVVANTSVKAHGFYYLTKEGGTIVALIIMDIEPHDGDSLKLGTAAILTFRKKGAGDAPSASDGGGSSDSASARADAPTEDLPVWTPSEKLAEELGDYQQVAGEGIEIRLPKGYEGPPGDLVAYLPGMIGRLYSFGPAKPAEGTQPTFSLGVRKTPPGQKPDTLDHAFDLLFSNLRGQGGVDWQHTAIERGKIGEMACLRTRCEGPPAERPPKMHGFVYACQVDANTVVMAIVTDVEPNHGKSLKLGNAAVLTLRKK
jgi:hypothetical protein